MATTERARAGARGGSEPGVALEPPRTVVAGRYELGEPLGAGGLAVVYRGRLLGPGGFARPVAVKRLHAHVARFGDAAKMFLDEARIASCIVHPNVVATLDVVADADELAVVMELVDGPSLDKLVACAHAAGTRVPLGVAIRLARDTLRGLHAAHEATDAQGERLGVVHRDVAPSNVLVGRDGIARLGDFGVAKARGRLATTRNGEVKGHLSYMAPEQLMGDPVDARADLFGVGVVLWELLTGRRLFDASTEAEVVYALLEREIASPRAAAPELSVVVEAIVMRALARDAAERFASAEAMADALDATGEAASHAEVAAWMRTHDTDAIAEVPALATDTWLDPVPAPTAARARRSRLAWGGAAAVAMIVAAAALSALNVAPMRARDVGAGASATPPPIAPISAMASAPLEAPLEAVAPPAATTVPSASPAPSPSAPTARAAVPREAPARATPRPRPRNRTPVRLFERD